MMKFDHELVTAMALVSVLWTGFSLRQQQLAPQAASSKKTPSRARRLAKAARQAGGLERRAIGSSPQGCDRAVAMRAGRRKCSVQAHPEHAGHFAVESGKQRYRDGACVATSTGAIRLEDAARGAVWLQLANKSMLMDHRQGRRLADACIERRRSRPWRWRWRRTPAPQLAGALAQRRKMVLL